MEYMKKIMSFNLKYDFISEGENLWESRVERIARIIKDNDPLIIGTQEGLTHMLKDMGILLYEYNWIGEPREINGEYNAIFYKRNSLKLVEWSQFWLSETPNIKYSINWGAGCKRICTWAKFSDVASSEEFIVYNTHLDNVSELARENGIKVILDFVKEKYNEDNIPFIIMGDFNSYLEDRIFKIVDSYNSDKIKFKNLYNECQYDIQGTFHEFKGGYDGGIIDYIIVSKEFEGNRIYIDDRVIDGGFPSDHYPVIAEVI